MQTKLGIVPIVLSVPNMKPAHLSEFLAALFMGMATTARAASPDLEIPPTMEPALTILTPKSGGTFTAPTIIVIEAVATDPDGDIRRVEYFANDKLVGVSEFLSKIAVIPGRPIHHRLEWKDAAAGEYRLVGRTKSTLDKKISSAPVEISIRPPSDNHRRLVQKGSDWRFLNDGSNPSEGWKSAGFDDSTWRHGPAELGYGEGDEATVTRTGDGPKPVTALFRHTFEVHDPGKGQRIAVRLLRDDGAIVYLNGVEVIRDNLPAGPIGAETLASTAVEAKEFGNFTIPGFALVSGLNAVAVEVHQAATTSSDLSFDLELSWTDSPSENLPVVAIHADPAATMEPGPEIRVVPAKFIVSRSEPLVGALAVGLEWTGSAKAGEDYEPLPAEVVIPSGAAQVMIPLLAKDDAWVEGDESVVGSIVESKPTVRYQRDPIRTQAKAVIHDSDRKVEASVTLTQPTTGAVFAAGAEILLKAVAMDPDGYLPEVEFYDSDQLIGKSRIDFIVAPEPGTPIVHEFVWKEAGTGNHLLTARAQTAAGFQVNSDPVHVSVGDQPEPVVVEVVATVSDVTEPLAGNQQSLAGMFEIRRSGRLDIEVPVYLEVGGTARNGVDYAELKAQLTLPAGAPFVKVLVEPLADEEVEDVEFVKLTVLPPACPEIVPPPPECYLIGHRAAAEVSIRDASTPANQRPEVRLTSPKPGAEFAIPAVITLVAAAMDPDGAEDLKHVEFFANGKSLGVRPNAPVMNPLGPFVLNWESAEPGRYTLLAKVTDQQGATASSEAVHITVAATVEKPVVTIEAADADAVEPPPPGQPAHRNIGAFRVSRTGSTKSALTVSYTVSGTASNGTDFAKLMGEVTLPAKATSVLVHVLPLSDAEKESEEAVILTIADGERYQVGVLSKATVTITDATPAEEMATIVIRKPVSGSEYVAPAAIDFEATTLDPAGAIVYLEYFAGTEKIGSSAVVTLAPIPPGTPVHHRFVWQTVPAGNYLITAQGHDRTGAVVTSEPVKIFVRKTIDRGYVDRFLPDWYVPGAQLEVLLKAAPGSDVRSYSVEDAPPSGWEVAKPSHEGVFDKATGKVKFGPFFDHRDRNLSYWVIPAEDAIGTVGFSGVSSADGHNAQIGGDQSMTVAPSRHPADTDPADDQLTIAEVSAYAITWKSGEPWLHGGDPIPMSYVSQAAAIWKGGEAYRFDTIQGAPPRCWVPTSLLRSSAEGPLATDVATRQIFRPSRATDPVKLVVLLRPPRDGSPVVVEEFVPPTWEVVEVSGDGAWLPKLRAIRWGPVSLNSESTIAYSLTAGVADRASGRIAGAVSWSGRTLCIAGVDRLDSGQDEEQAPPIRHLPDGSFVVCMGAASAAHQVMEVSQDLVHWDPVAVVKPANGKVEVLDEDAGKQGVRFYRISPVP